MFFSRFILILIILISSLYSDNETENKMLEKVSVQLHWKYQFEFAGFIAAIEKGFYEKAGLDVELKEYEYGTDIVEEVIDGKSNYGVYNSNILISRLEKKPIKLLASFFKRSALVLLTNKSIKTPKDLIGKKVMSAGVDDFEFNFGSMLKDHNINIDDINLFPHTYNTKDFEEGTVDAITAFISDQTYDLNKKGFEYNILDPSDYGVFSYQLELFTSEYEIQTNPKKTQAFRDATIKGWEYALAFPNEIIDIIYDKYSRRKTKEALWYEAKEIKKLILPHVYNIGLIDENFINRSKEIFQKQHNIKNDKFFDGFIYRNDELKKITLTETEKKYIENNVIKWSTSTTWAPFNFRDHHNEIIGISIDYWKKIIEYSNIKTEFIEPKNWDDVLDKIQTKEIDITIGTSKAQNKDINADFSMIYATFPVGIATQNKNIIISDTSQLNYRKVAVGKNYSVHKILKEKYPKILLQPVDTIETAIDLLAKNEVYAVVDILPSLVYNISKKGYANLNISGTTEFNFDVRMMVNKENQTLLNIINKSIALLSPIEKQNIYNKWITLRTEKTFDYQEFTKIFIFILVIIFLIILWNRTLSKTKDKLKITNEKLNELNLKLEERIKEEVNKRVAQEHILAQQNKLASMGEMINDIAHQWRQPLAHINSIILNIDRTFDTKGLDREFLNSKFDEIEGITEYMSNTISDFQHFFKPDKKLQKFDIKSCVERSIKLYESTFKDNNIEIVLDVDYPIIAIGYENEYVQIIMTILNNAKYVLIERNILNKKIFISLKKDNEKSVLTIEDNAGGVNIKNIEKIFEPYFTTKHKNQGTGLGLYISKMIIERSMDGKLSVENSKIGAKFKIEL